MEVRVSRTPQVPQLVSLQVVSCMVKRASLVAQTLQHRPAMQKTQVRSLGQEEPLEKEMASHFSVLAWRIP